MSKVFVGVVVVLAKVLVVELEVLLCPKDDFSRVDFTEPMIPLTSHGISHPLPTTYKI